jgi:glycosyltransferase involved in cell wall biosynthesis
MRETDDIRIVVYNPFVSDLRWVVGSFRNDEICRALSKSGVGGTIASPYVRGTREIAPGFDLVQLPSNPVRRVKAFVSLAREGNYDIIQERPFSKGVVTGGCGFFASLKTGLPFVLELHNIGSPLSRLKRLPSHVLSVSYSDLILSYSNMTGLMALGARPDKVLYVPNGYSSEVLNSVRGSTHPIFNLSEVARGRAVFGFFGGTYEEKGVDLILEAARLLRSHKGLCFVFAGKGNLDEKISEVSMEPDSNVHHLGLLGREETLSCMSQCRATLAVHDAWQSRVGNPVKVVESLALGVPPIITADQMFSPRLKSKCIALSRRDPSLLAELLVRLSKSPVGNVVPKDIEEFSTEHIARSVIRPAYERLVQKH